MEYLRTLANVNRGDESIAGERAVDLAILNQKGFDIPLSFVLLNNSFEDFVIGNKFQFKISKILNSNKSLKEKYDAVREVILKGKFPENMIKEFDEAFESLVVKKDSNVHDLLKEDEKPFVTLVLSTNYELNYDNKEGIIINVHGFEDFLDAIKECWACLFTADMQAFRKKNGINDSNLNVAIIIHNMKSCEVSFESYSAMNEDNEKIKVNCHLGFPDLSDSVEKDEFRLNREFLKIEYQGVAVQTHRLARGLDDKLDRVAIGTMGEEQKLNDRFIMEIARLTKKASNSLGSHIKLSGYVKDDSILIYLCDKLFLDSSNLDQQSTKDIINEEPIGGNDLVDDDDLDFSDSFVEPVDNEQEEQEKQEEREKEEKQEENEEGESEEQDEQEKNIDDFPEIIEKEDFTRDDEDDVESKGTTIVEEEHYSGELKVPENNSGSEEELVEKDFIKDDLAIPTPETIISNKEISKKEVDEEVNEINEEEHEIGKVHDNNDEFIIEPEEDEKDEQDGEYEENDVRVVDEEKKDNVEYEEYEEEVSDDIKDEEIEEVNYKKETEYEVEEEDDDSFYDAFDKVKQALLNKYEERFRKLAPENLVDVFIELNNEIIVPHDSEIGLLLRIFEQEKEYTDEEKNKILEIIDDFVEKLN